jgi:hypothetical protein
MSQQMVKNDMVSYNFYCRNKLKKSLTYSICNGNFKIIRSLLEDGIEDINETGNL